MTKTEQARLVVERMQGEWVKPRLPFTLEAGEPGFLGNKVGGIPYLPRDMAWPTDRRGKGLTLLAQINCAWLKGLPEFPHAGLLQFFIGGSGNLYGMDFDDQTIPDGFRVLYHEQVDASVTPEQVQAKRPPDPEEPDLPLMENAPCRIRFGAAEEQGITGMDFAAPFTFVQVWNASFPGEPIQDMWDVLGDIDEDVVEELLNPHNAESYEGPDIPWHQLGGYPYFTQTDPRERSGLYGDLDTVLFQLDSDSQPNKRDFVLWGDCGVGNFFINHEALKRRDFSRVAYNWDCC